MIRSCSTSSRSRRRKSRCRAEGTVGEKPDIGTAHCQSLGLHRSLDSSSESKNSPSELGWEDRGLRKEVRESRCLLSRVRALPPQPWDLRCRRSRPRTAAPCWSCPGTAWTSWSGRGRSPYTDTHGMVIGHFRYQCRFYLLSNVAWKQSTQSRVKFVCFFKPNKEMFFFLWLCPLISQQTSLRHVDMCPCAACFWQHGLMIMSRLVWS